MSSGPVHTYEPLYEDLPDTIHPGNWYIRQTNFQDLIHLFFMVQDKRFEFQLNSLTCLFSNGRDTALHDHSSSPVHCTFLPYKSLQYITCTIDHKSLKGRGCWNSIHFLYLLAKNTSWPMLFLANGISREQNQPFLQRMYFLKKRGPSFPMSHALTIFLSSFFTYWVSVFHWRNQQL